MATTLFAERGTDDASGAGLVLLAGLVVLCFVLRWLYRIGFYGKALRAFLKTAVSLGVVGGLAYGAAAYVERDAEVEAFVEQNADGAGVAVGILMLVGLVSFYERPAKPAETRTQPRPVPIPAAGPIAGSYCPACRGSGQVEHDCYCNGGETRCSYVKKKTHWWGEEFVAEWCDAGTLRDRHGDADGKCRECCGRGFVKCWACRGRGVSRGTCERCQGKGLV